MLGVASVANGQVWSLTQFYTVDFSHSRIGVQSMIDAKVRFKQNQGLRQLFLMMSWDHRA